METHFHVQAALIKYGSQTMAEPMSISELREQADYVEAEGYTLECWSNGTYFIEAPNGEGTEVPEEAIAGAIAELFRRFFDNGICGVV